MMLIKAVVSGLLALFVVLVGVIVFETSRMIVDNWRKLRTWPSHPRREREDMALWVGLPLVKVGLMIFALDALVGLIQGSPMSHRSGVRGLIVLPFLLGGAMAQLWLVLSLRYGSEPGDFRWILAMLAATAFGLLMFLGVIIA